MTDKFFAWLRRKLGITGMHTDIVVLHSRIVSHDKALSNLNKQITTIVPGLGRIIAKADALYATDEQNPERVAESKRIGEETIRRLRAEAAARAPYNYDMHEDE